MTIQVRPMIQMHDNGNADCVTHRVIAADGTPGPWMPGPGPEWVGVNESAVLWMDADRDLVFAVYPTTDDHDALAQWAAEHPDEVAHGIRPICVVRGGQFVRIPA